MATENAWITAELSIKDSTCTLKVENSKPLHKVQEKNPDLISGIGLENVRRQLDLVYPGRYHLKVNDQKDRYLAVLTLDLNQSRN